METNTIQDILTLLANGQDLSQEEATHAFQILMNGGATPAQTGAFLMGLRAKGETVTELTAGAHVLRTRASGFNAPEEAIDTCGTGGDMKHTLNVSTAVAIVTAACGVPVVKHGNRAISSASGSSDVLKELGVNVLAEPETMQKALDACGLCFLMAPKYHAAMRHVAPVRTELGLRTIFNLLGPLANPAKVKCQLLGVYDKKWLVPMAETMKNLGSVRAWAVCGEDGMDEITITGITYAVELKKGRVTPFTINPADYGIALADPAALQGQDAAYNARALMELLSGKKSAYRDIVLLNAAAALVIAGKAEDIPAGMARSSNAIDEGRGRFVLAQLAEISRYGR